MKWWNGPVLILFATALTIPVSLYFELWRITIVTGIVFAAYYGAYEYMHWCMHLPKAKRRLIERRWFFYRLNGHHLLHHRYMNKNFNVVLPVADLLFGTLRMRSPTWFAQAVGPSVPNVQPKFARSKPAVLVE